MSYYLPSTLRGAFRLMFCLGTMLLVVACSSKSQGWQRIGQKDFQELLPQMLMAEAVYEQRSLPDSLRILGYQTVLGQRGYTLTDWDSSQVWYGRYRVSEYQEAYDYALGVLTSQQEGLRRRVDSLARIEARAYAWSSGALDSTNLLLDSVSIHRPGDYLERSFSLSPSVPYASGTDVRFAVRLHGFSPKQPGGTLRMHLRVEFTDSTQRVFDLRPLKTGLNVLSFVLPEGKMMRKASGWLRGVSPRGKSKFFAVDSFSFARFPGKTPVPAVALDEPEVAKPDTLDAPSAEEGDTF